MTHTHRQAKSLLLLFFVSVCHIYIPRICFVLAHCAYSCCCSLVSLFFLFNVVIRCHCRLLLCLKKSIFFPFTHCSILGMATILIDGVHHHAIPIKLNPAQMCVSSIRSDFNICLSLLASLFLSLFLFFFTLNSFACVYFVCVCVCLLNYTNRCVAVSPLLFLSISFFSYSTTTRRFSLSLFLWFFNCIK